MKIRNYAKTKLFLIVFLLIATSLACELVTGSTSLPTPVPATLTNPPEPPEVIINLTSTPILPTLTSTPFQSSITQQNPRKYRVKSVDTVKNRGFAINKIITYQTFPIEWDGQQEVVIESVTPEPSKQSKDPVFGNGLYFWDIKDQPKIGRSLEIVVRFTYTAYEITSQIDPKTIQPYDQDSALYRLYTQPERFIEADDPQIINIADDISEGETNPYLLAQKFYDYVIETAHYKLVGKGLLGAKALLTNGVGECGDYSALFIALSRARGIPARPVIGYWAISGTEQTHVWAEFYLEGIGWIPVDPTIGQQSTHDQKYYFGNMDNQRVILHKGFNLQMDPPAPDNDIAPLMQGPSWWFWGSSGDASTVEFERTNWIVTPID